MKKKSPSQPQPKRNHFCNECAHARLMQTSPHNPVLAQCRAQHDPYYPMFSPSPFKMFVASQPCCDLFIITMQVRTPELVAAVK